eukprot:scaffold20738_cov113-Isochrysis_galbana.AAC.2
MRVFAAHLFLAKSGELRPLAQASARSASQCAGPGQGVPQALARARNRTCIELSSALDGRTRLEPGSGSFSSSIGCEKREELSGRRCSLNRVRGILFFLERTEVVHEVHPSSPLVGSCQECRGLRGGGRWGVRGVGAHRGFFYLLAVRHRRPTGTTAPLRVTLDTKRHWLTGIRTRPCDGDGDGDTLALGGERAKAREPSSAGHSLTATARWMSGGHAHHGTDRRLIPWRAGARRSPAGIARHMVVEIRRARPERAHLHTDLKRGSPKGAPPAFAHGAALARLGTLGASFAACPARQGAHAPVARAAVACPCATRAVAV